MDYRLQRAILPWGEPRSWRTLGWARLIFAALSGFGSVNLDSAVLDKQKLLEAQTFWDNRDWEWYQANIPFFECPDPDLNTTYYYRWEVVTKHLTYGSPDSGYSFTEFIDRPFWSGAYGAISCPAGHQLYEVRWLRDPRYARDYARYWFRTPGAQPRRYSTWLADAVWACHEVHPDGALKDLLPDLVRNFEEWERRHFVPEVGLFWQNGHDDGMEYNINSRQTQDIVRGGDGFRPTLNSYLYADALAIARVAEGAGNAAVAQAFAAKAAQVKERVQALLWDPKREFFLHRSMREERDREGNIVKANTLTHETGKYAGSPHGREEIGFVPWQFNLPDAGYESAWKFLMDAEYFAAPYGPATVERGDPMFYLSKSCCWWSGMSWPYATTQTLKAMANLLQNYEQRHVRAEDYVALLQTYARTHRKAGQPYIAEAAHPETGSWEGHDGYNHSEHYFHSGFCDLVLTGLIGLRPLSGESLEVQPLAPESWSYFAVEDVVYHGHSVTVLWDKDGQRYGRGAGLQVLLDGQQAAASPRITRLKISVPRRPADEAAVARVNHAVNNEGAHYPRVVATSAEAKTPPSYVTDGNYWYHRHPPNRWVAAAGGQKSDSIAIDFGQRRRLDTLKLYFLDDGTNIVAPASFDVEYWNEGEWKAIGRQVRLPERPTGRRANTVAFERIETSQVRAILYHREGARSGLTEFEAWGEAALPYAYAPPPEGNLAFNRTGQGFPEARASFSDRYGGVPKAALDGKTVFRPTPMNRWTSYGSTNATDWIEIDFGQRITAGRVELAIYDDGGGVQAPAQYRVQVWSGVAWTDVKGARNAPERPTGGMWNSVRFEPVSAAKLRVVFEHRGVARSGVTELEVWEK